MQRSHRLVRKHQANPSIRSLLALAVSDALASCRRAAAAPRWRDAQAALALAAATAFAVASVPARAQDSTWTGAVSNDWFDGGNWSGGVPTDATDALIDTTSNPAEIDAGGASVHILTIGAFGAGSLSIVNGGTLSSHWGAIGDGGEGVVTVTGAGSSWRTRQFDVIVGWGSSGGLFVQDGGLLEANRDITIGQASDSRGEAVVTGASSRLISHGSSIVGVHGIGSLTIRDGGQAISGGGVIALNQGSTGEATVAGAGSRWSNAGNLTVGDRGNGVLVVESSGAVDNQHGFIGNQAGSVGMVTVTGDGSSWINRESLTVGGEGHGLLQVLDGGDVESTSGSIDSSADSGGGVEVIGTGSSWKVGAGSFLIGDAGTGRLRIEDGGTVESKNAAIGHGFVDYDEDAIGSSVEVIGSGATWTNAGGLLVGENSLATMEILVGGQVQSGSVYLGTNIDSEGRLRVNGFDSGGASSRLAIDGNLLVGDAGTGKLLVDNAGLIENENGIVGNASDSTGRSLVIGGGSTWANRGSLSVGRGGEGILEIFDGGRVESASAYIGNEKGSNGKVKVSGIDSAGIRSRWEATMLSPSGDGDFIVGYAGTGLLSIEAGGAVSSLESFIGYGEGSIGKVTVTGADSGWDSRTNVTVGQYGRGTLLVEAGGAVNTGVSVIGTVAGSVGEATVTGADSRWNSMSGLYVGYAGTGTLAIEDGGAVSNTSGWLGVEGTSSSGEVTVNGARSTWTNSDDLSVGHIGTGMLFVEAGGTVSNQNGVIGNAEGSTGEVTVTGAGSSWINAGDLLVGREGNGTLTVEAGGVVENAGGRIGSEVGSAGAVTVTGAGSTWTNEDDLHVGSGGSGVLEILDGGRAEGWDIYISRFTGSDGVLKVSGTDSAVAAVQGLFVGYEGSGRLLVEAGGSLSSGSVSIANQGSPGAKATATGSGTTWNSGALFLGNGGGLGELEILDGAMVNSGLTQVGQNSDGTALVDGPGSQWYVGPLVVNSAHHAQVVIRNGGLLSSATGIVGNLGDFTGTVRIQGAGSAWVNLEDLYIGSFIQEPGTGALTIDDGGRVEVHAGNEDFDVMLARIAGSTGTLNIGAGGAAGVLDSASVTGGAGTAILNFNHDEADYAFTNDGTGTGAAVLIDGSTAVNQIGTGTTTLLGANTYTGATNVDAGTLLVEGALGNTATTVADGGTLGGSGSIAGAVTVADGGILAPGSSAGRLTVGSLSLSGGSILDYELGQAGVIGGGVNDLIEVTGDLTLDGTLDITDIGGFGAGVYRLINYGGDLTDNGLEIGTRPAGADANDLTVQTGFDGQVNLASTAGLMLGFWDGATGHGNDAVDGGNGTWNAGNSNWTTADGATNGRWDNGTFAVFGGTAGNVEVMGEQAIAGLQFMSGYTLRTGTDGALRIDGADSVIRVDPGVIATLAAPITGAGGLVKTDTGTLVLSGTNSYEGGTRIDLGTLQVASDANLGAAAGGLVFDGGTLHNTEGFITHRDVTLEQGGGTFLTDAGLGLDGVVSGAGTLTKDGDGTLTLTVANTYTGGTRVLAGTLVGDAGSIRGDIDNDGSVVFDQADDGTFAGAIAGTGTMTKDGAGALTLAGNSALDWSIDAGALVAQAKQFGGDASIADGARLRFIEAAGTYAGTLSGAGAFEIAGGETVFALTGNSAGFTGTTSLESGTLQLGGALGGNTLVANGALLTGIGRLGSVDNHGTIAPGNSIGTLTLAGDYLHHDDATLLAEIEPGGGSDLLEIAGRATLEGGTVEVTKAPGQYEGGTRYTLIDAAGGVSGTFGTLDQDLPFLDLLLGYDANHVYLDVQRSEADFDIVCGTGTFNQCQVAGALDAIGHDHPIPDDLKTVLTEVTSLTLPGAQAAFDTLSGEAHASAAGAMLEGHALYGQTVARRLAERREAVGAQRLQGGAWARGYGMGSELDGDGNAHGARLELYGLAAGVDAWATESWLVGASVNTLKLDADFRAGDGAEADAKNVSLYTSVQGERGYLDAVASFAWWNSDITRRIEAGDIAREARSDYGMDRVALALEAGLTYDLGNSTLQPLLSLEYSKLSTEGFREDGADEVDLIGRSQDAERTVAGAGVRWTGEYGAGEWTFAPTAQARWLHTFGDLDAEFDVAFAGAPETPFRVRGVTVPEERGLLGIGLQASRDALDLFLDLDYQAGDGFEAASFGAGMRWRW